MPAMKLTLQNRITTLMIISSVIFISAFTFIQLNNQIANIDRYNKYRADLSTLIVKNNLEAIVKEVTAETIPQYIKSSLISLSESNITREMTVFDTEGTIIASTKDNDKISYKDMNEIENLKIALGKNRWFISSEDKTKQKLYIYIAINKESPAISYVAKLSLPLASAYEAFQEVYWPITVAIIVIILANIVFGFVLSKTVIGPIRTLNQVTKIIAAGDLSVRTDINTQDELEELGSTFNYMTEELAKMKERAENANPLTKLPGNIVIHEEIEKRIKDNRKFMVIYCDLDNFKAFNDKYGIAKGDEAIKLTSEIFKDAVKDKGEVDDFLGHEGGDDFILLTVPEKAQGVADYITQEFDKRVRALYNEDDLQQGHIIAHARDGSIKEFPLMTISLAGITNAHRKINSYGEVTNIAAEVKKKAKAIEGSVFVIDKRTD